MIVRSQSTRLAVALVLAAIAAPGLAAQATPGSEQDPAALEQRAQTYLADMDKWNRAADLYRQAAELRRPADATAIADLKTAARLEFYRGSERQAVRDLESAGQRALAIGDIVGAANSFADAAWIAGNDGDALQARELMERAQLLALSPLISPADRSGIESRLQTAGS